MVRPGYRQLIVMRHAKTEQVASSDRVRELTARGRDDAQVAGRWLSEHASELDLVLTSPAARAHETAELVIAELPGSPQLQVVDALYQASAEEVLQVLAAVEEGCRSVLVVGHNPTMEEVAQLLPHGLPDPSTVALPTAGLVVMSVDASWSRITAGSAEVMQRYVARA